jgi:hypothetical protein
MKLLNKKLKQPRQQDKGKSPENSKKSPENQINYLAIIKKSVGITVKNRFLWIFGIFIALTSGTGNIGSNFGGQKWEENLNSWKEKMNFGDEEQIYQKIVNFWEGYSIFIILIGVLLFLFGVAIYIFKLISHGALIDGINKIDSKIQSNFKKSFSTGLQKFWRLLGINLTILVFILITVFTIAAPIIFFFSIDNSSAAFTLLFLGILLFLLISIFFSLIAKLAYLFTICVNQKVFESLGSAYDLLRLKMAKIIIAWIIELVCSFLMGTVSFFVLTPFIIIGIITGGFFLATFNLIGLILLIVCLFSLFIIFESLLGGLYLVFIKSFWVLFFKEIAGEKIKSKKRKIKNKVPNEIIAS